MQQDGEITVGSTTLPTFRCFECLMDVDFQGEPMQLPLVFAVRDGVAFDPAAPDGRLNLSPADPDAPDAFASDSD